MVLKLNRSRRIGFPNVLQLEKMFFQSDENIFSHSDSWRNSKIVETQLKIAPYRPNRMALCRMRTLSNQSGKKNMEKTD